MVIRIVLAALIGGGLAFCGGFIDHMLLDLEHRHMSYLKDESTTRAEFQKHFPDAGIYGFPSLPKNFKELSKDDQKKVWDAVGDEYKKGPSALVVVAPTGQEMMSTATLASEAATNIIGALLAAIILAATRPNCGFFCRWLLVVLMGTFAWVSVSASYHIWYRFPLPWVLDELYCQLIEWGLAGIAIAAIVRPRDPMAGRF